MNNTLKKEVKTWMRDLTSLGGAGFFILLIIFSLILRQIELAIKLSFGFLFSFIIVALIRTCYFKDRPKKKDYTNFIERIDASSFPSLHTGRAVFLAGIFMGFFKQNYFSTFLVIIAILIAYSRIHLKKHDWWDILGGVVLGLVTLWVTFYFF